MCVRAGVNHSTQAETREQLARVCSLLQPWDSWDLTWVFGLRDKHLYPLKHLTGLWLFSRVLGIHSQSSCLYNKYTYSQSPFSSSCFFSHLSTIWFIHSLNEKGFWYFFFWGNVPGWLWTHYIAQGISELLNFLPPPGIAGVCHKSSSLHQLWFLWVSSLSNFCNIIYKNLQFTFDVLKLIVPNSTPIFEVLGDMMSHGDMGFLPRSHCKPYDLLLHR